MKTLEARIKELCARLVNCISEAESAEIARELHTALHDYLENARSRLIVVPGLLGQDHKSHARASAQDRHAEETAFRFRARCG